MVKMSELFLFLLGVIYFMVQVGTSLYSKTDLF